MTAARGETAATAAICAAFLAPGAAEIAGALDGQAYLMPCGRDQDYSALVCANNSPTSSTYCPNLSSSVPYLLRGYVMRDQTITVGGTPGAIYDVTLRVRGVIEPSITSTARKDRP